jgi:hypothetical protein
MDSGCRCARTEENWRTAAYPPDDASERRLEDANPMHELTLRGLIMRADACWPHRAALALVLSYL